jgi:hypothetical protein
MIFLDTTTRSLQIALSGSVTANQLPFVATYADISTSNFAATAASANDGASNGATPVTVVAAPASSTTRVIKTISIQNADTASTTMTLQYNDNSTLRTLIQATLSTGDQLYYEDGQGFSVLDKNGNLKTSGGGTPGGTSGQIQYNNGGSFGGFTVGGAGTLNTGTGVLVITALTLLQWGGLD